ncbi:hypothetical protein F0562_016282 [Nyssa sinensis]|uniref:BHLH domain-containing protein n=1 Tax=Nyssa sinensis TaxID=561372 RepID=A0A5J4ZMC4_9ASTE|nr:hypothetical protein F0562_016282 [Nyssa sinensis]
MGTTPLRQFLQSLCHNSYWNYAVFWKLQHQSQTLLTWEDGYCACPKLTQSMESILDDICFNGSDGIFSSSCESSIHEDNLGESSIGLAVADLSRLQYALGEGVVGDVAYTGNHCWLSHDNISAGEFNYKSVHVCPDEWLLQFLGGIKTILLVPVVPHGVLQLGSLKMVAEDLALVAYIQNKFHAHQNFVGYSVPYTSNKEFLTESSSSLMSVLMENLDELSTITMNKLDSEDSMVAGSVKLKNNKLSTTNQMTPLCTVQDAFHISGKDLPEIFNGQSENDISVRSMGLIEVSKPDNQSLNANKSEMMESSIFRFSGLEEELEAFSYTNDYDVGVFGEYAHDTMNSYFDGIMTEEPFVNKDADNTGHNDVNSFFSFPMDCELHKALGPTLLGQTKEYLWDLSVSGEDASSNSSLICNRDLIQGIEPSAWESSGCLAEGDLLETVAANLCSSSDDNSSSKPKVVKSSMTSSAQFAAPSEVQRQAEGSYLVGDKAVPWSRATSAFVASGRNDITNSSPSTSSFESMMSTLIEEKQQQKKGYSYLQPRKGPKPSNVSKRRARPGDNQKPRPRDRQLIQDRVKELRELVPNGTKCSIDGLLDQTIKHMLFLRNVTDQADKLRQWAHQEVIDRKDLKSSESKGACQNGTSWAFELGSELQVCPIVVEDLECPGHMLIRDALQ